MGSGIETGWFCIVIYRIAFTAMKIPILLLFRKFLISSFFSSTWMVWHVAQSFVQHSHGSISLHGLWCTCGSSAFRQYCWCKESKIKIMASNHHEVKRKQKHKPRKFVMSSSAQLAYIWLPYKRCRLQNSKRNCNDLTLLITQKAMVLRYFGMIFLRNARVKAS